MQKKTIFIAVIAAVLVIGALRFMSPGIVPGDMGMGLQSIMLETGTMEKAPAQQTDDRVQGICADLDEWQDACAQQEQQQEQQYEEKEKTMAPASGASFRTQAVADSADTTDDVCRNMNYWNQTCEEYDTMAQQTLSIASQSVSNLSKESIGKG